jgi:3-oxoacyl-[acyl-carrier-protein] synthase II
MTPVYINGTGIISPQKTLGAALFPDEIISAESDMVKCKEPNYKEYVSGDMVRRMSRLIKMGVTASKVCLQDGGCSLPDAIITGTGLGCIEDTEKFLASMISNKEEFLTPTSFIQSTHNTVGAQIALILKCHNYNFTYVHRGFSFESALLDAMLQVDEDKDLKILVGGLDELTKNSFHITRRLGLWKTKPVNNLDLLKSKSKGSIAGEGAAFFLVSGIKSDRSYAMVSDLKMLFKPENAQEIISEGNHLSAGDIDLLLLGLNGDASTDVHYHTFSSAFPAAGKSYFKHLCGEYFTSSSFGLWLGSVILKHGQVPDAVKLEGNFGKPVRNILLYNHFQNLDHSLILLQETR